MKDHRELFERYKRGILEDARIEELHQLLVEVYFSNKDDLDKEEKEFAEDLIFEKYTKNELEIEYADLFRNLIDSDKALNRKYFILKNLVNPQISDRDLYRKLAEAGKTEEQEEEALKSVLLEVLEEAHAEEQASSSQAWLDKLVASLKNFLQKLLVPFIVLQPRDERQLVPVYMLRPQVKVAFAFAALSGLALIVWFSVSRKPDILIADNSLNDTVTGQQIPVRDSGTFQITPEVKELKEPGNLLEEHYAMNERQEPEEELQISETEMPQLAQNTEMPEDSTTGEFDGLLASMYAPPDFEYNLSRGENPDVTERLAWASYKYNGDLGPKDYDSCIIMLEKIMEEKVITDKDTLNMIRFYLGNSYLKTGIDSESKDKIEKALRAFKAIDPQNDFYLPAKWYSALAYMKLGNTIESLRLCDSLVQVNYSRMGNVEVLRDSLYKRIGH